jgi:hypothetical protein
MTQRVRISPSIYRRVVESQLRPWAWTLPQLRGRRSLVTPELSNMRDMLVADGHPLLAELAVAILLAARNAAAHEDYAWDDAADALSVGNDFVTVSELEDATDRA